MPMVDMPLEELQQYKGLMPKPANFDAYWADALAELDKVEPNPVLEPATFTCAGAECFHLYFTGVGGARIHAKYLRPTTRGQHPCVLLFHGYTVNSGDWSDKLPYLMQGMCVAALDCRGQGGLSEDLGGVHGTTCKGHIIRGLQDGPEHLLYRDIFLDTVQLQRVVASFEEVDAQRLATSGGSQGGGLATACAALGKGVQVACVQYPFLSDYKRVWQMDLGSLAYAELPDFFRRFDPMHQQEEKWFGVLSYIDVRFLAQRITARTVVAIGLNDRVCPPSSQFAVYNNLVCKKRLALYPDFGHEKLPEWADIVFKEVSAV